MSTDGGERRNGGFYRRGSNNYSVPWWDILVAALYSDRSKLISSSLCTPCRQINCVSCMQISKMRHEIRTIHFYTTRRPRSVTPSNRQKIKPVNRASATVLNGFQNRLVENVKTVRWNEGLFWKLRALKEGYPENEINKTRITLDRSNGFVTFYTFRKTFCGKKLNLKFWLIRFETEWNHGRLRQQIVLILCLASIYLLAVLSKEMEKLYYCKKRSLNHTQITISIKKWYIWKC